MVTREEFIERISRIIDKEAWRDDIEPYKAALERAHARRQAANVLATEIVEQIEWMHRGDAVPVGYMVTGRGDHSFLYVFTNGDDAAEAYAGLLSTGHREVYLGPITKAHLSENVRNGLKTKIISRKWRSKLEDDLTVIHRVGEEALTETD